MDKKRRLTKDQYLWKMAFTAAVRGTCDRFRGGSVVARDGILIATGYNGSAPGEVHCDQAGHEMIWVAPYRKKDEDWTHTQFSADELVSHCVRTIHSEINVIINAASLGVSIKDCDWYFTGTPCERCSRAIARLLPQKLFICTDFGGVDDNKKKLVQWWRKRVHTTGVKIHTVTHEQLIGMGVTK